MRINLLKITKIAAVVAMTWLYGCASQLEYSPNLDLSPADAKRVIEQVIMEQHPSKRPNYLEVTDEYIAYTGDIKTSSGGVVVGGGFVVGGGKSRQDVGRIYFSETGEALFLKRKSWYVAQLNDHDGKLLKNYYSKGEMKAKRFVDAVMVLKSRSHDPFAGTTTTTDTNKP